MKLKKYYTRDKPGKKGKKTKTSGTMNSCDILIK